MAIERKRGCGYRKVDGLYLVCDGPATICDRLPFVLQICPVCGAGIKFSRGFTWVIAESLLGGYHQNCKDNLRPCPVCDPNKNEKYGLMWVGKQHYTPETFMYESEIMGVSKRIAAVPRNFKVGFTWILLAHKKVKTNGEKQSAIFTAFKPTRIEKLITKSQATEETLKKLERQGITPVVVPNDDKDHNPKFKGQNA